jgi:hypothetical protein
MPIKTPKSYAIVRPKRACRKQDQLVGTAWAWKIQDMDGSWHLCHWSEPTREQLERRGKKPSPEAVPVRVRMSANTKLNGASQEGENNEQQ